MRKILLLSAAAGLLFVGSIFVGVAAATTASPVLYDARTPRPPSSTTVDGYVEAGGARDGETDAPGAADSADEADASDDVPRAAPPASGTPPRTSPSPSPAPPADPGTRVPVETPPPEEQHAWLAFQQLVRECMADAGQEYRHWEWWNTDEGDPDATAPAMPPGLTAEGVAAWELAFSGSAGTGDDVAWEQAGCWGAAMNATGDEPRATPPDAPQADRPPPMPMPTPTPAPTPDPGVGAGAER